MSEFDPVSYIMGAKSAGGGGGGGGDFDAIIHYSHPLDTSAPAEITIERGSYAALYQKLNSGQTPSFLITVYDPGLPLYYSTAAVYIYSFDSADIYIIAKVPTLAEVSMWPSIELLWNNDDTITQV